MLCWLSLNLLQYLMYPTGVRLPAEQKSVACRKSNKNKPFSQQKGATRDDQTQANLTLQHAYETCTTSIMHQAYSTQHVIRQLLCVASSLHLLLWQPEGPAIDNTVWNTAGTLVDDIPASHHSPLMHMYIGTQHPANGQHCLSAVCTHTKQTQTTCT
jgi:hypothetical protein